MAGKNIFNSVKMTRPKKSRFDLSHDYKTSFNMGELIPTCCLECIPGDSWNIGCESLLRFAPMVAPIMHRVDVYMHYFFVPFRILWPNWERYITNGGSDPIGTPPDDLPAFPYIELDAEGVGTNWGPLADYFGIGVPTTVATINENVSAMPFAAYQKIWDEYYRDQNMYDATFGPNGITDGLLDGNNAANSAALLDMKFRAWEHDYFTSALPFAQKGEVIGVNLGTVELDTSQLGIEGLVRDPSDMSLLPGEDLGTGAAGELRGLTSVTDAVYDPNGTLIVPATNINDLRVAFRLQEWLEKNARGGTRYVENILAHFGVRSSDKRMQRPEYITGTKSPVVISEVLNTTGTEDAPQGEMAGHGVSVTQGKYGRFYCEEHGYIIGIMSVLPKTAYYQGIPKHFLKINDPTELAWPSFANLGEQEVIKKELWSFTTGNDAVFGYVPRYSEYKYHPSIVTGDFRNVLEHWHMGRKFSAMPSLNPSFVESNPTHRIFAVTDSNFDKMYAHVYHKLNVVRALPKFGIPTF